MTAVAAMVSYHDFGRVVWQMMREPNIQVGSQRELAEKISETGFKVGQQMISDYIRLRDTYDEDTGEYVGEKPRAYASVGFLAAFIDRFDLDEDQRERLISSWWSILPDNRKRALSDICEILARNGVSPEARQDMIDLETDRGSGESVEGDNERSARNTET